MKYFSSSGGSNFTKSMRYGFELSPPLSDARMFGFENANVRRMTRSAMPLKIAAAAVDMATLWSNMASTPNVRVQGQADGKAGSPSPGTKGRKKIIHA